MYISICRVLTNCITNSNEYSLVASFSVDSLYMLFCFLNDDLYCKLKKNRFICVCMQ